MELKRKSPLQLQSLEKFYAEEKYPTHKAMKDLAASLDLTYKQVRTWFIEKRRKDKNKNILIVPSHSTKKFSVEKGSSLGASSAANKIHNQQGPLLHYTTSSSKYKNMCLEAGSRISKRKKRYLPFQDLLTPDYILSKIFRKDGPPLGLEFDSRPSSGFPAHKDSSDCHPSSQDKQRASIRRKLLVSKQVTCNSQDGNDSAPLKKHGMGKGLMRAWLATNPNGGDFPTGIHFSDGQTMDVPQVLTSVSRKPQRQNKKRRQTVPIMRRVANKTQNKKRPSFKRREVQSKQDEVQKVHYREKCELALQGVIPQEHLNHLATIMDDEELELRELQAGPNPVTCSEHFSTSGLYGCSLCKGFLAKFPPSSVKMKQPFTVQPWDSSPETVKKLFKVLHFLYTYCATVDICPFTLDELAQAFHDKDSLLLGKIHVAVLELLLSDVETEISTGFLPHLSMSCKFLALLHSVEDQKFIVEFWKSSLNPVTWIEILRQVLVAAGFGSKQGACHKEYISKEMSLMMKYSLRPRTLKGELFRLLLEQGNSGLQVSDLAKSPQIAELNLGSPIEELEVLICSTLSSDITLFEKIASSAYRVRINTLAKESDDCQSDSEDSGSVHHDFSNNLVCSSSDSECDSESSNPRKLDHSNGHKSENNMLIVYNEIDESHPGEPWLLGLLEGEYSDLSVDEKLNALVALIDLVSAGSSIRLEDPTRATVESIPSTYHHGSGAKIKRSSVKQRNLPRPSWVHVGQISDGKEGYSSSEFRPVDSSVSITKVSRKRKFSSNEKREKQMGLGANLHPMQSIFLGSDRRYNRYWLFLGPCNFDDPGHKRVYFESSEDGHWEVIDTEDALHSLLSVLDGRGQREALLIESLEKRESFLCQEMSSSLGNNSEIGHFTHVNQPELQMTREDSCSPVSDVDNNLSLTGIANNSVASCGAILLEAGKRREEENRKWFRLQEFDAWIWNDFYSKLNAVKHSKRSYYESLTRCETCHDLFWRDEKHCRICHTTFELDFDMEERYAIHSVTCREKSKTESFPKHKVFSSQLQSLKAAVHAIESVMPEDSLLGAWTKSAHKLWVKRLRRTSSLSELLQVVADFVAAVNEDWLCQRAAHSSNVFMEEIIACFPTMPQTSSALALWLVKLDELIFHYLESVRHEKREEARTKCTDKHAPKP